MKLSSRAKAYLEVANQHHFKFDNIRHARNGHLKVDVTSANGVTFEATLPCSPSDNRGHHKFVQTLKRLEREISNAKETTMPETDSRHSRVILPDDLENIKKIMVDMCRNPNLLLMSYNNSELKEHRVWFLNTTRTTADRTCVVPARNCHFLLQEGIIQVCEDLGRKVLYSLTEQGYAKASALIRQQTTEAPNMAIVPAKESKPEEPVSIPVEEVPESEAEYPPAFVIDFRDRQILQMLRQLSDEEVKAVLYYGFESLKEDIQKELEKRQQSLTVVQEGLSHLFQLK